MNARMRCTSAFSLTAVALLGAGCQTTGRQSTAEPYQPPPTKVSGTCWVLVSLAGTTPESDQPITLELAADRTLHGFAGVNQYVGSYDLPSGDTGRGRLAVGQVETTKMAGTDALMKQENDYLDLLRRTDSYMASGGLLELSASEVPTLRFRQVSTIE